MRDVNDSIYGPWEPVRTEMIPTEVPTVVNGFGRTVESQVITIERRVEQRKVWQFIGWEERTVES
jgi:hypothetical protein